jgi:hypothetical protein
MFGVVFGRTAGVTPGYELSLTYKRRELYSEGEYVVDTRDKHDSFFYSWSELRYSPVDWCHVGLVDQGTKAHRTGFEGQRGVSLTAIYQVRLCYGEESELGSRNNQCRRPTHGE